MRAVSDAGPLIHLSWIDKLDLLQPLFEEIAIPPAVQDEVLAPTSGTPGLERIQQAFTEGEIQVRALVNPGGLVDRNFHALDKGESEAILFAQEVKADLFITDDSVARVVAYQCGLRVVGTLGILTQARDDGLVEAALPLLVELRRLGQWISEDLIETIQAEEPESS